MSKDDSQKTVVLCDTQPITAEGLRTLLTGTGDLELVTSLNSLEAATPLVTARPPDVVIVDKGFGMRIVLDWIRDLQMLDATPAVTVWGNSMTEAETLRLLQAGAKGVVLKTADLKRILSCLRAVASGRRWTDGCLFRDLAGQERHPQSELTPRQQQVREMAEQGFKNKEIALQLGIRPGTVKIHLRHIFIKTGVRGRYSLAISGLKEAGSVSMVS